MDKQLKFLREYWDGQANCPKDCIQCCKNPVSWSEIENERFKDKKPPCAKNGYCEWLDENGKCSIYDERPMMCRAFGKGTQFFLNCDNLVSKDGLRPDPPGIGEFYMNNPLVYENRIKKEIGNPLKNKKTKMAYICDSVQKFWDGKMDRKTLDQILNFLISD